MPSVEAELIEAKRDTRGRRVWSAEERERRIAEYRGSGLTQKQFARREGLPYGTFVAWLGRGVTQSRGGQVEKALRRSPAHYGLPAQLWDGPLLSSFLKKQFGVTLRVRQCQRFFRRFGFRLRTPRPEVGQADPATQAQ